MEVAVLSAAVAVVVAVVAAMVFARRENTPRVDRRDLAEMRSALDRMDGLVRELELDREAKFGELAAQLRMASQQTAALTDTAGRLREALAGTKSRGQWGERMAEDVLRAAGLIEHVNYRKQTATAEGGIPDFTFLLPGDQVCHMDVKFPLDNYVRAIEAEGELDRQRFLKQFRRDVRQRVTELAERRYEDGDSSLDVVLLFIPNEQLYGAIFEHDPDLLEGALARKVVLCSPTTLFAVLAVIRQAAESFRLQQRSREIVALLGGFAKQWGAFTEKMDCVGRRLDALQKDFDAMVGVRRRQLERQLDRVEDVRRRDQVPAVEVLAGSDLGREA
ncbi:MAG: DNA recombination protein RmuC [Acidimicrobiia bacterium]|nr:DNA recombination protein RmuC [Acidimicrobiia bacterium]